jgi:uroporphyrinogen-III synthase
MRVLITRPEREAAALAEALGERGHQPVVAPLFSLRTLPAPAGFAAQLAEAQAVLLTSANGARALAETTEQRGGRILAVGDTTASTAEGLGFSRVVTAAGDAGALAELVRQRLDPKAGPLLHVSGADVAADLDEALAPAGFTVRRVALYEAREAETLPEAARAALQARALDVAMFFSPRAGQVFARLVDEADLGEAVRNTTAVAISPAAAETLAALPFRQVVAAARPTRQAVLDEIDRIAAAGVQGQEAMSDTQESSPSPSASPRPSAPAEPPPQIESAPVRIRRGLGVVGAFICGLVAACVVLAAAIATLPQWPADLQAMWRGQPPAQVDVSSVRRDAVTAATNAATTAANAAATSAVNAAIEASKRELAQRLDDIDKRVRAAATTAATAGAATPTSDPAPANTAIAELRKRIDALETRPADGTAAPVPTPPVPAPSAENGKDLAALRLEIATLRSALQALDQAVGAQKDDVARQREQTRALATAVERSAAGGDQKALGAARASAVIGLAARLSAALESGLPYSTALGLLTPLAQGDARLGEVIAALQANAASGVPSRQALAAEFPAVAKRALADDLADDSLGERVLGKIRGLISLRRVGPDVAGDSVDAKLARAEAALDAGDVAKAVELVRSLPPQTTRATASWLARAETHLAARRAVDQLAAHAVNLLGAAR